MIDPINTPLDSRVSHWNGTQKFSGILENLIDDDDGNIFAVVRWHERYTARENPEDLNLDRQWYDLPDLPDDTHFNWLK